MQASIARRPLLSSTTSLRRYSSGESLSLVHGERPSMFAYLGANQPVSRVRGRALRNTPPRCRRRRVDGVKVTKFDLCAVCSRSGHVAILHLEISRLPSGERRSLDGADREEDRREDGRLLERPLEPVEQATSNTDACGITRVNTTPSTRHFRTLGPHAKIAGTFDGA